MSKVGERIIEGAQEAVTMADLEAENKALRAVLQWYEKQASLCRLIHSEGDAGRNALSADGGFRARAILET